MPSWLVPILGVVALVVCLGATYSWYKKWKRQKDTPEAPKDASDSNKKV